MKYIPKIEYRYPDASLYQEPIDSGLTMGMSLKNVITTLAGALRQANNDRAQINDYVNQPEPSH